MNLQFRKINKSTDVLTFVSDLNIDKQKFQNYEIILYPRIDINNFLDDLQSQLGKMAFQ